MPTNAERDQLRRAEVGALALGQARAVAALIAEL